MLVSLDIRDILIIDHLTLDFQAGLNVLTGETGAGKSIMLDALGFVLGWRGRAELVRQGAGQGEVNAIFELGPDHPSLAVLEEAGISAEDGEVILRRVNSAEGRKTAWINGRRVTGDVLRDVSDHLLELHGQHDDRGLLNARGHRALLDDFADLAADLSKVQAAWRAQRTAAKALADAQEELAKIEGEAEFLTHAVGELDQLAPELGEEVTLDQKRRLMKAASKIGEDIERSAQALSRDGAEGNMADATRWLEGVAAEAEGQLDEALAALGRAQNELAEAQSSVEHALQALAFNPAELEQIEDRLFAIRALARKHNVAADDLPDFAEQMRAKLARIEGGGANIEALRKAAAEAEAAYQNVAEKLRQKRQKAARALDKAMAAELAPLKMEAARFETSLEPAEAGPDGIDLVTFTVATNPGAPAGALNKIASGGELSRFLLALKVCLTRDRAGQVMIFDEIDRGVGGATADAVGRRLAALADGAQVLVVTHSPQVAARGAHHWRVSKSVKAGQTLSRVEPLDHEGRVDELARMLAGDQISDAAREAARELLAG